MARLFGDREVGDVKLHHRNHTPEIVECSAPFFGSFISWKDQVAIAQEAGWVSEPVWTAAKISPPKRFEPRTDKNVDSRCTSYVILAVFFCMSQQ